ALRVRLALRVLAPPWRPLALRVPVVLYPPCRPCPLSVLQRHPRPPRSARRGPHPACHWLSERRFPGHTCLAQRWTPGDWPEIARRCAVSCSTGPATGCCPPSSTTRLCRLVPASWSRARS